MWYYRLRDYISWIIISALLAAIVFYGYRLSNEQNVLRLGTGAAGSLTHEIGRQLKDGIERHSDYQVRLLPAEGSRANREALLRDQIDMAIMAPAVVSGDVPVSSLAVLGMGKAHLLMPAELMPAEKGEASWQSLAGRRLEAGPPGNDAHWLARQFLLSTGLDDKVSLVSEGVTEEAPEEATEVAILRLTSPFDDVVQAFLDEGGYRLTGMDRMGALLTGDPLLEASALAAGTYVGAEGLAPLLDQSTLATPVTLMVPDKAPRDLVYRLMAVLEAPRTQQSLAPYGFDTGQFYEESAAIVRHPAASEYLDPSRAWGFLGDLVQGLLEYRWLTLLVLLLVVLGHYQWRQSQRQRRQRLEAERHQLLKTLLRDVLKIEAAQRDERDWKALERYRRDLAVFKQRGIEVVMDAQGMDNATALIFTQQCHQLAQLLEARLSTGRRSVPTSDTASADRHSASADAPDKAESSRVDADQALRARR